MNRLIQKGVHRLRRRFAHGVLILVYHRVNETVLDPWSLSVTPDHFAEHLEILRQSFYPTSLQALAGSLQDGTKLKPKSIVITFDDGYADNLQHAKPILERFDCPATIFLVSGTLGSSHEFWWDELCSLLLQPNTLPEQLQLSIRGELHTWHLGKAADYSHADDSRSESWRIGRPAPTFRHDLYKQLWQLVQPLSSEEQTEVMSALRAWAGIESKPPTHRLLTQKECLELARGEQIEIGAHTIHHPSLASLPYDLQCAEILESKQDLEELLSQPVNSFSYPFGKQQNYTPDTVAIVQEAGFSAACCNESGVVNADADPFLLPRVHVPDCSGTEFENRLLSKFHA
jgi:peptidoglycan/xylan/chitin deacetylase (PgdA/CDA1 family)